MLITLAKNIRFSPERRCPTCDVGVLPYGLEEPFVVGPDGSVYCRDHGSELHPEYAALLAEYRRERKRARDEALDELEGFGDDTRLALG